MVDVKYWLCAADDMVKLSSKLTVNRLVDVYNSLSNAAREAIAAMNEFNTRRRAQLQQSQSWRRNVRNHQPKFIRRR